MDVQSGLRTGELAPSRSPEDALRHSDIACRVYEHIDDSPFVGDYRYIFLSEPRRVKLVDGEFVEDQRDTAASAKAILGVADQWLVDTGCGHDVMSALKC